MASPRKPSRGAAGARGGAGPSRLSAALRRTRKASPPPGQRAGEALAEKFFVDGLRTGRAFVMLHDWHMSRLPLARAAAAVERMVQADLRVKEAACEAAASAPPYDGPDALCDVLAHAYWRGVARGVAAAHDVITGDDYGHKSARPIPAYARDGVVGRILRAARN